MADAAPLRHALGGKSIAGSVLYVLLSVNTTVPNGGLGTTHSRVGPRPDMIARVAGAVVVLWLGVGVEDGGGSTRLGRLRAHATGDGGLSRLASGTRWADAMLGVWLDVEDTACYSVSTRDHKG